MRFAPEFINQLRDADKASRVAGTFKPTVPNPRVALFVDGGSGVLVSTPNYAVAFIRVYWTMWRNTVRDGAGMSERLVFFKRTKMNIEATIYGDEIVSVKFDLESQKIPIDYVDRVRKHLEVKAAIAQLSKLPQGACIVLDGDLDAEESFERLALDELKNNDERVVVAALSKTNRFVSNDQTTLASDLARHGPAGTWLYELKDGVGFVRLHADSAYVFRLDSAQLGFVANALLPVSADPVFLGYPYPLVEADARARVSHAEVKRMNLELRVAVGKLDAGAALDAHSVLDALNT